MQSTRTEERTEPVSECICEGVNVDSRFCAVEGHTAFWVVHKHAHPPGSLLQSQQGDRRGVGSVLPSSLQAQSPETVRRADSKPALPVYGLSDDTQAPLDLLPDLHLPVAPPAAEAFLGQYVRHAVEPLRVIGYLLELVRVPHLFSVIGDGEVGVGCLSAQVDVH